MTLNGVMDGVMHYFTEFGKFGANYIKMIAVKPMLFCKRKCSPKNLIFSTIGQD